VTLGVLLAVLGLGAFHGLNPGMGWLFAVSIGLQERRRGALLAALGPIAAGHAASVLVVALLVVVSDSVLTAQVVAIAGGLAVAGFGLWRLLSTRHFRWVGMRLSAPQLGAWSFLMSSAHGAGLMLLPVLVGTGDGGQHGMAGMAGHPSGLVDGVLQAVNVTALHTAAMVVVAGAVALVCYDLIGLRLLRTAWVNLDRVWAFALIGAGGATVLLTY
jgi:hypothetical protein